MNCISVFFAVGITDYGLFRSVVNISVSRHCWSILSFHVLFVLVYPAMLNMFLSLQLLREADGHFGFINSICFDPSGRNIIE